MQTGDLATGAGDPQSFDDNPGAQLRPQLLGQRGIDPAGGPHRITVGPQVVGRNNGLVAPPHDHPLGGGGTDIKAQNAAVARRGPPPGMLLEIDPILEPGQGLQIGEIEALTAENPVQIPHRPGFVVQGPAGGPQGLHHRGLIEDQQVGNLLAQVVDHGLIGGTAPDQKHPLLGHLLQ